MTTTHSPSRAQWADTAKALSIVLVVLAHAFGFLSLPEITVPPAAQSAWQAGMTAITPIRVPLFFLVSGFFAVNAIQRPWAKLLSTRVANSLWTYALWLVIIVLVFTLLLTPPDGVDYTFAGLPQQLLMPVNHIWYLWALPVYLVIARALRRWPLLTLAGALVLNLISALDAQPFPDNVVRGLFFFLVGAYAPMTLTYVSARLHLPLLAGSLVAYGVLAAVVRHFKLGEIPAFITLMSLAGVTAVIQLSLIAVRSRVLARIGSYLGGRTLPIYVMHYPLLVALAAGTAWLLPQVSTRGAALLSSLFPALATAAVVGVALVVYAVAQRSGGRYLFTAPTKKQPAPPAA